MARLGFGRSILVDAAVNAIPLSILIFFLALFLAYDPWPAEPLSIVVGVGLLVVPIAVLLLATAVAAYLIQADEVQD